MESIEFLRQEYLDNPCTDTRHNLVTALLKAGAAMPDRFNSFAYFAEVAELAETNYAEDPRYETRRLLAVAYIRLGESAGRVSEFRGITQKADFFKKAVELFEINVAERPSFEARKSLSLLYRSLIFVIDPNLPESTQELKQLYLKKVVLDEANYSECPDKDTFGMLGNTYYSLAEVILKENTPEAISEAEKWLMTDIHHRQKYFDEHPGSHFARMSLVHGYHRISALEKRKGTPESKERSSMWQKKITETINTPLKRD